ncbi:glycine cleavage system H protein, mitochondrial [Lycorma delicatula]|uniref:glycine cleavage system H protein, mitochondrial n=1 Tax=Lycorma delicatula TaxID=130591 RepID=UPI003F5179AA
MVYFCRQILRTNLITHVFNNSFSCQTLRTIRNKNLAQSQFLRCLSSEVQGRLYTNKHEWVLVQGDVGVVGISHYAQDSLGDVVYAQLPEIGTIINKEDEIGALESVKAASELYSPVSGKVVEKNKDVEETPALINQSCYEKGWLFKVQIKNGDEIKDLMNEEQYKEFLKTDPSH